MKKELLGEGAEAKVFKKGSSVIKERLVKRYRLQGIDAKLRRTRTRREAKILESVRKIGVPAPVLIKADEAAMQIEMSFLEGERVRDVLAKKPHVAFEIGQVVGRLHKHDIIHADLTTSNMVYKEKLHLLDFGLSFVSAKVEDKAVDLHLLDRALESKHHELYADCIPLVFEGYEKEYPGAKKVLERLKVVQKRGRNKK